MYTYDTVAEAVNGLKERGYTIDFNLEADQICCKEMPQASPPEAHHQTNAGDGLNSTESNSGIQKTPLSLKAPEFEITEVYRFEGDSDPADEAVVYAIESRHGQRGVLVNGFGVSADGIGEEMIEKLSIHHD